MGLIIDTGVFIKWERSGGRIDFFQWEEEGDAATSVMTMSELLVGVKRADSEKRQKKRSKFVESVLAQFPILDFTSSIARVHADLHAALAKQGQMIGVHDLIIAATAKHGQDAVLTTNVTEFQRIPDLKVIEFAEKT